MSRSIFGSLTAALLLTSAAFAQTIPNRYALILDDPPVSRQFASRAELDSVNGRNYRRQIEARQQTLRDQLAARDIAVTSSVSTVLNAIFVTATKDRLAELQSLPGVKGVVPVRRYRMKLNRATQLVNAQNAWNNVGGMQNAGAGMKIAILDTGIDQTHPAFQDPSLKAPAGFPVCNVSNCAAFTSNKVIVARSYVPLLAAPSDPKNPAADSRPDDYSPRDRQGHGTATASCAAAVSTLTPAQLTISGVAPKAFLGNYKIFGSPGVNDGASDEVIIQAFEDALADHMDVASLSVGGAAFTGPLDTGAACGQPANVPCDLVPPVIENVVKAGMVVVVAAGNDGDGAESANAPVFNTIESPGDAPSAITVGATTNSHFMSEGVEVTGPGVPSNLQRISGVLGNGPVPIGAVAGGLIDVTQLGDNGLACNPLPAGSLGGAFVLIERGTCNFSLKVVNAQNAGAQGVIFYMADQTSPIAPGGLGTTFIPAIMISNADGVSLKSFADSKPGQTVLIDAAAFEQSKTQNLFNTLAFFSSLGPSLGDNAIKPEIVAVGGSDQFNSELYMPAQSYDFQGILYSVNGYAAASGTSFSTPLVAGAAALVKQAHPNYTAKQIRSALINTASHDVTLDEQGDPVTVQGQGAGKLDVNAAIQANATVDPPTLSFGVPAALPSTKTMVISNNGSGPLNLSLTVASVPPAGPAVTVIPNSLSLAPGATGSVSVTVSGATPTPASYTGAITIQGGSVPLSVPYMFFAPSRISNNLTAINGDGFDGTVGQVIPDGNIAIQLVDDFGVPVAGSKVTFTSTIGGGTIQSADAQTNAYGIATAVPMLGSKTGRYDFTAVADGLSWDFAGNARAVPNIFANGITNGASFESKPVAPGSYVSVFGSGLSDVTDSTPTAILPLSLDLAMVSFDVPAAKISQPGRMIFISPGQLNIQVPWELQGQTSALVKATIDFSYGNVYTLALSDYAPAFFEIAGSVAARDANGGIINTGSPAAAGQTIQIYANGLGPVSNQPATGDPAPSSPLALCKGTAQVQIGAKAAAVGFCGLAPGFPALYQLNVTVPSGLTSGPNPITVAIGGQTSRTSSLPVK